MKATYNILDHSELRDIILEGLGGGFGGGDGGSPLDMFLIEGRASMNAADIVDLGIGAWIFILCCGVFDQFRAA